MSEIKKEKAKKKEVDEKDKKNTQAWKQKQAQKKKATEEAGNTNESKVEKKTKKKDKEPQPQPQPKVQVEPEKEKPIVKQYKRLKTIETTIIEKYPDLKNNRKQQLQLLSKAKNTLVKKDDTVIYIGNKGSIDCAVVEIPNFTNCPNAEIICRYEDVAVVLQDTVNKIFIEADVIFGNGSILAKRGSLNIVLLAKHYKKTIIGSCGSWTYCGDCPISDDEVEDIYGDKIFDKYDFIEGKLLNCVVMESGSIIPGQIMYHVGEGYKGFGLETINW